MHRPGRAQAERNPGTRGVGFTRGSGQQEGGAGGGAQQAAAGPQQAAAPGASGLGAPAAQGPAAAGRSARGAAAHSSAVEGLVEAELGRESVEAKVAQHRAAAAADEAAAAQRALQRALFRSFNDPFDNAGYATANTNPLGRKTRLTATNPLLGSDSD